MNNIEKYKKLLSENWIKMTDNELSNMIDSIDSMWNLLFKKYMNQIQNKDIKK